MATKKAVIKKVKSVTAKNDHDITEVEKFRGTKSSTRELETVNTKDTFWSPEKKGDLVEGEFQELERSEGSKFGETEIKEVDGKKVKVKVSFRGVIADHLTGDIIKMPSTKMLNEFFENLPKGTYVRIIFNGKKLKKGKEAGKDNSTYNDYILQKEGAKTSKKK